MKFFETNSLNPYYNLAFEEWVLKNYTDEDCLILWQNDNTIVVGVNQNPLEEINIELAKENKVNIVRRTTGGGTVYHDLGNLNFSFVTNWSEESDAGYKKFLTPVIKAFESAGIQIEAAGRNDMLIDGKKISGNAQKLYKDRILHHGTLLINSDLSKLGSMLNVSAEKIKSKGIKSVKSRVANIQDFTSKEVSVEFVKKLLIEELAGGETSLGKLDARALREIEKLQASKYDTWEWNYGRSLKYSFTNKKRFVGGGIEVNMEVIKGRIEECLIFGDFLSLKEIEEVEKTLKGVRHEKSEIDKALDEFDLKLYFGEIAQEEITSCFFE